MSCITQCQWCGFLCGVSSLPSALQPVSAGGLWSPSASLPLLPCSANTVLFTPALLVLLVPSHTCALPFTLCAHPVLPYSKFVESFVCDGCWALFEAFLTGTRAVPSGLFPARPGGCLPLPALKGTMGLGKQNCKMVLIETPLPPSLQEYIRLLQPWCHVNMGSCCFMMGRCYLVMGEGHKVRRLSPASTGGLGPPPVMGAGNISLELCLLWAKSRMRGTVGSALGAAALMGWCWNGQRRLSSTAGWASPPRGTHKLLSGVLPGPGLLLPSCLRGGKRRVLGQADPTRGGRDGLHTAPAVLQQGTAEPIWRAARRAHPHRVVAHQHYLQRGFLLSFWGRDFRLRKHCLFWGKMSVQSV